MTSLRDELSELKFRQYLTQRRYQRERKKYESRMRLLDELIAETESEIADTQQDPR